MKPRAHQTKLVEILREKPRYYLNWACGSGKTFGVLNACAEIPMRSLILAPKSTLHSAWLKDAAHTGLRVKVIRAATAAKRRAMIYASDWDVAVTNYDAFKPHVQDYRDVAVRRLVIDEASKVKNPDAAITKACITFADAMESVICLSGYPAPQGPQDWWSQMRCVDRRCLGDSFWRYAYAYTTPKKRKVHGRDFIERFDQTEAQRNMLRDRLAPWVWSLSKAECMDLPPQADEVRIAELDAEERRVYRMVEKELTLIAGDAAAKVKAEAVLIKLRQVVGGSVLIDGCATSIGSSKMEALVEWIEELGPDESVIVWAEFQHEIIRLVDRLSRIGPTEALYGATSDDSAGIVGRFRDGPTRFLVAHPACAAHGTDGLQVRCSYAAFFALNFNSDQHVQARDRIHRSGMGDRPATYLYLVAEDTVDESMRRSLSGKKGRADAITDAIRQAGAEALAESVLR
jgi:SNF2 family DNA or RNA helicase